MVHYDHSAALRFIRAILFGLPNNSSSASIGFIALPPLREICSGEAGRQPYAERQFGCGLSDRCSCARPSVSARGTIAAEAMLTTLQAAVVMTTTACW